MKTATIDIKVTATVNGEDVECELGKDSTIIVNGNIIINDDVELSTIKTDSK